MKVITVKSNQALEEDIRLEVHHGLGMEQYSDHVFKDRGEEIYSATIVVEDSVAVLKKIIERSAAYPDCSFVIDDLDMDANTCERLKVQKGKVEEKTQVGWTWD